MTLHFKVYGHGQQGPPVIILHGLFGSLENWAGISGKLAAHFRVYALDLRNHGGSAHRPEMTYEAMAGDVGDFMGAQGLERAHLIGHSLGGKVAMQFALAHPERVERLVVVDIAPRAYPPHHVPIINALLGLDLGSYQDRRQLEQALASSIPELEMRRFLLKNVIVEHGKPMRWRLDLGAISENYARLIEELPQERSFAGPVLFLRGGRSDYVQDSDLPMMRKLFPASTVVTIPGADHWVHADAPEEFVKATMGFLLDRGNGGQV